MKKKKLLIGGGIVGALVAVLLLGGLATGAFSQASTLLSDPAITADEAKAAALEAYPGTNAVEVELERENGTLVYEVELDNGLEVAVDANDGAILGTEQEDADGPDGAQEELNQANDADEAAGDPDDVQNDVQDEFESQADDALETPQVEDAPGQ